MSVFSNLLGATIKTMLLPVAVTIDVVKIATLQDPESTMKLGDKIGADVSDAIDDLGNGKIL